MNKMNKKAIGDVGLWIIRLFLIGVVISVVVYATASFITEVPDTKLLENELIVNRLLNSPNGIVYVDPATGRAYPTIIDPAKFGSETLNKSLNLARSDVELKISLKSFDGKIKTKPYYTDEVNYVDLASFALSKKYAEDQRTYYVLIKKGDELLPGLLQVSLAYATGE